MPADPARVHYVYRKRGTATTYLLAAASSDGSASGQAIRGRTLQLICLAYNVVPRIAVQVEIVYAYDLLNGSQPQPIVIDVRS